MNRHEDSERSDRSKPPSRRNSISLSRRSSLKDREKESTKRNKDDKSPTHAATSSVNSTPKKSSVLFTPKQSAKGVKKTGTQNLDFIITGKQILKRSDRANSLPGTYHRRLSTESTPIAKRTASPKRIINVSQSPRGLETSLEDDMSLDLSQVSDFEDINSKYGIRKFAALATSTPKPLKPRSGSLQNQLQSQKLESRRPLKSLDSSKLTGQMSLSYSRDSFRTSSTDSPQRYTTELDYSSVSPEYSGQSSADLSPTRASQILSPRSQDLQLSSTWQDCSEDHTKVEGHQPTDGEWSSFWANYNNSLPKIPLQQYYDQCPTPYRSEQFETTDFELPNGPRKRSPDNIQAINNIICNEGIHLTPRETQNIIKCAHLLGNVLSKALERRAKNTDMENPVLPVKKKTMTLDLKETNVPLKVEEEKRCETVTTQTDISLPNTNAAPRIFESILRQLSKSSIDVEEINNKVDSDEKIQREHDRGENIEKKN